MRTAAFAASSCCGAEGLHSSSGAGRSDSSPGSSGFWGTLASLRRKAGHFIAGKALSVTDNRALADEAWLSINSRCRGSMARVAKPNCGQQNGDSGRKQSWNGFCSVCKRPLAIEMIAPPEGVKRTRVANDERGRYAFVIALWGTSPEYVFGAMVLGWSLRKTGTKHDLVLVHTDDVSEDAVNLMKRAGWLPRQVEYISASQNLSNEGCTLMRFAKVFTKLRVLQLVEYEKILMMDIDLLVKENIDDLFDYPAPMAMVRGPQVGYKHGERVNGSYFFFGIRDDHYSWGQSSGINAGVMLLRPDEAVFQQMMSEVTNDEHPEHIRGNGPEQDYLSRFYADEWRHLSVAYNFQLHHMYFSLSPTCHSTADRTPFILQPDLIKIIHYSSEPKPWSRCLEEKFAAFTDDEWLQEVLLSFTGYRAWVLGDVEQKRREATMSDLVLGPDGHLHKIDWSRVPAYNGGYWNSWGEPGSSGGQPSAWQEDKDASSEEKTRVDDGPMSEDGQWPIGEAVLVPESSIKAAENTLRLTQELWFNACRGLAQELGENDLPAVIRSATTGPIIREEWDWNTDHAVEKQHVNVSYQDKAWAQDPHGWWVEGPVAPRYVASCSTLPQKQATLLRGSDVLLAASSDGVHVAAVSGFSEEACPCAQSLPPGPEGIAAATVWVASVPDDATVLLASIDATGQQLDGILEALVAGGLGCPSAMPDGCSVAAGVGQKGERKWKTTHAAANVALATSPQKPATMTNGST